MASTSLEVLCALVPAAGSAELAAQEHVVQDSLFPDLPDRDVVGDWDDRSALAEEEMTTAQALELVRHALGAVVLNAG